MCSQERPLPFYDLEISFSFRIIFFISSFMILNSEDFVTIKKPSTFTPYL